MSIFHFLTATPITNHPKAKEFLSLGNFVVVADNRADAWSIIKDRPEVRPALEVWGALVDEGQRVLVTPHFIGCQSEDWLQFVEWCRIQEQYYLVHRAGLALEEWKVAKLTNAAKFKS